MRWCIYALCFLAWPTVAQNWSEIEPPLKKIENGLDLIGKSTAEISDYFKNERESIARESAGLQAEKLRLSQESERLAMESSLLSEREQALRLRETGLEKRGQSLDAREGRVGRLELMLKAAPVAVILVAGIGFLAGRSLR